MAEDGEEIEKELIKIDYDEIDQATGFKVIDKKIWDALEEWKAKPEDDREPAGDPAELDSRIEWAKWFAAEGPLKPDGEDAKAATQFENRCVGVIRLGLYSGQRDEFLQRTGKGKAVYPNGDTYDGQFFEGKKNGQGMYAQKSVAKAEVDKLIEDAVLKLPETDRRTHEMHGHTTVNADKLDGFVEETVKRLAVGEEVVKTSLAFGYHPFYLGEYQNGIRNGVGVMKSKDGSVYKGEWVDGKRHGQGILYFTNGDTYSGHWQDGAKTGFGTYSFAYWSKVTSSDGKPVYTFSDGGSYRGEWGEETYAEEVDGEKAEKTVRGLLKQGEWHMPIGFYYEGTFNRMSQPHTQDAPACVLNPDGTPLPAPSTCIHFPRWGLAQAGVMDKVFLLRKAFTL
ncbi:Phosphatidylinositol 4-phosphate 5-kinase 8 [Diplonema papillatum]|nr:Phosphatidylinositol 4-phosphate 5-kinase 8 [Diplonema papillatum]